MAVGLYHQRKWDEAASLCKEALDMRIEVLGKEHPDVAVSMYNMGNITSAQRGGWEPEPALDWHRQALELREKLLGGDHPDLAASVFAIAMCHWDTDRDAAAQMFRRYLSMEGKLSESVELALAIYGVTRSMCGSDNENALFRQAIDLSKKLNSSTPQFADCLYDCGMYASLYLAEYALAESLLRKSLEIRRNLHQDLELSMAALAHVLKLAAADKMAERKHLKTQLKQLTKQGETYQYHPYESRMKSSPCCNIQ